MHLASAHVIMGACLVHMDYRQVTLNTQESRKKKVGFSVSHKQYVIC
jgi:hypothetical protein